ncbi:MAG: FAD-binding protein [Deltaproteobacteria bacterium]|nr:FAD-binding protein [Deltaproteobacteria bacterium]
MAFGKSILGDLKAIVGEANVLTSAADLAAYSYDGSSSWQSIPGAVVFPSKVEHIAATLELLNRHGTPVTVRGAGTCLSGGPISPPGGVVLCMTRMNRIVELDREDFTVKVEPGVVLHDLNRELAKHRLFFPPDPQSFLAATIGGCVAEGAGGPYAVKYGVFKHYLLGMTVVLASGAILELGGNTMKNVTGYDLPQLICGSEGTLAVIAQVTLRLLPLPEARCTVLAIFNDVRQAGKAVHRIRASGVVPAKIELMDNWMLRRIEELSPLGLPLDAAAILLFEMDGSAASVAPETQEVIRLCQEAGAIQARASEDAKDAERLWGARRAAFSAVFGSAPTVFAEDVTVPVSKIPDLIDRIAEIRKRYDVSIVLVGHAGDGNLHPSVLTDKSNAEHCGRAEKAVHEIFVAALALGGAISGEHGIGLEKRKFLKHAMQPQAIDLLRQIKSVFDPKGILNPGKIWE